VASLVAEMVESIMVPEVAGPEAGLDANFFLVRPPRPDARAKERSSLPDSKMPTQVRRFFKII
jgi:hypothetical protein